MEEKIDWSLFDGDPENTCYCRCGQVFRSHSKSFYTEGHKVITRKPCPQCGRKDNCHRISSDPEIFTIGTDKQMKESLEISKIEAKLVLNILSAVQLEGMGIGNGREDALLWLQLVEKIFKEYPDLTDIGILEGLQ